MKAAIAALFLGLSLAACGPSDGVAVSRAEFRPPLGSSGIGAAYFTIQSAKPDRIVAVSSSEADAIEIHASVTEGDNVRMERLTAVELPAGKSVSFQPGGMHLMVFSPRQIAAETTFPITIELESGLKKTVAFERFKPGAEHRG